MAKKSKQKFYVVWQGVKPGVYKTWAECLLQVKGYPEAKYKAFPSEPEAYEAYYGENVANFASTKPKAAKKVISAKFSKDIVWESISVDAACAGNPGVMEYQGVDTKSEEQIFHMKFPLGTNNIGEFLGIVHALAMLKKQQKDTPIYSDSKIAMGWVVRKKCKTTLVINAKTKNLHTLIYRGEKWLRENTYTNKIMKWDTKSWGEIPADFGRKK